MSRPDYRRPVCSWRLFHTIRSPTVAAALTMMLVCGCDKPPPIVTYTIPTQAPEQLRTGNERMLASIVPKGEEVWFFKVVGPETAIESIESTFRQFVSDVEFEENAPSLSKLPVGWRRGGEKPMRYATLDVDTPGKQLNISVSKLGRQDDWDAQVKMNVNRWRGQLGLSPSDDKWAEGEPLEIAAADGPSVWVDLIGDPAADSASPAPMAGMGMAMSGGMEGGSPKPPARQPETAQPDPRLKFDRPEGWRDGRMTSMRMAAFNIGPEDSQAELTVIPAGGDLRGNVARWLGQVRDGEVPDEVVDSALAEATEVDVDGRAGQRFLLTGEDATAGTAIDATIVPLDGGMSLFVKMTGPAKTVSEQADAIASFLDSLKLNL